MGTIGTLPDARLTGLSADLFYKLQEDVITLEQLALFVQGKDLFGFRYNKHGHIVFPITGLYLTGKQEIKRLKSIGFRISNQATESCLLTAKENGYDKFHRLKSGREYKIALAPVTDIGRSCTVAEGREYGASFGYEQLLAGAAPRIREFISNKMMKEVGFRYIAVLHNPIKDSNAAPHVLSVSQDAYGQWLNTTSGHPDNRCYDCGAFAYHDPASN